MNNLPRLAILSDFVEEGWPSMDLVADELSDAILAEAPARLSVEKIRPAMRRRFGGLIGGRMARTALNLDRLAARFVDYPVSLRRVADRYDVFHIADHSYAHLAHGLPAGRIGVFCHDLDAFRCLIEPSRDRRPVWFRKLATRTLRGLQKASVVFCNSMQTRDELLLHRIVAADRIIHAPLGVASEFHPGDGSKNSLGSYLLHVGSCISRKRVDVLLEVMALLRRRNSSVRLVHVGAPFSPEHERLLELLELRGVTISFENLTRDQLANLYRSAELVLVPSESEGFGLPVIEALACGTRVVASDIQVLREVGGEAVTYCPVGDVEAWANQLETLIRSPEAGPSIELRAAQAALYTWQEHARIIVDAYESMCEVTGPATDRRRGPRS